MLRSEKEINNKSILESILIEAKYCVIALSDGQTPYTVPMNFGFKGNNLYIHSAPEGRKIEILKANNKVSFVVMVGKELVKSETPCDWGMKYKSVMGSGWAYFIEDSLDKRKALDIIMEKYTDENNKSRKKPFEYSESSFNSVVVIRVELADLTCKISRY